MATEVTPTPDLSTMTQALPSLSQADLQTLQTNITVLLQTLDNSEDTKMESLLVLPTADVFNDFSLGSLDTTNLIKNTFDNYLFSSPAFQTFSTNISFSLVGKSGSPSHFPTRPAQTL